MKKDFVFSSASVTEGHPAKLCDQISDAIVDPFLAQHPLSRVVAECAVSASIVFIAARFASDAVVDFPNIARKVIKRIGYNQPDFKAKTCSILTSLKEMPADESCCFDEYRLTEAEIEGISARDQATVFGFACNQTPELMRLPISLAHRLAGQITLVRQQKQLPYLAPEAEIDVGVEYRNRTPPLAFTALPSPPARLRRMNLPWQSSGRVARRGLSNPCFRDVPSCPMPTRNFISIPRACISTADPPFIPASPAGRTPSSPAASIPGRAAPPSAAKIPCGPIGSGGYAAKNLVAAGLVDECEVHLSYYIACSRPVSVQVESFNTGKLPDEDLAALLERHFNFRPAAIMKVFNLRRLPA